MICLSQSTAPIGAFPEKTFRIIERIIAMYNLKETGKCVKKLRCNITQEELATENVKVVKIETGEAQTSVKELRSQLKQLKIQQMILTVQYVCSLL